MESLFQKKLMDFSAPAEERLSEGIFEAATNQQDPVFLGNIECRILSDLGIEIIHVGRSLVDQCFHSEMTLVPPDCRLMVFSSVHGSADV